MFCLSEAWLEWCISWVVFVENENPARIWIFTGSQFHFLQETTQQTENLLTNQVSGRQDTCYGFSPGKMLPVSPQWGSDGTYSVAADSQFSVLEYFSIHHADRAYVQQKGPSWKLNCLYGYIPSILCSNARAQQVWPAFSRCTPTSSMSHTQSFCTLHISYSASFTNMHPTHSLPQLHTLVPSLLPPIHLQLPIRQWKLVLLVLVAMSTLILICMEAVDMYVAHPIADRESPTARNVCHE